MRKVFLEVRMLPFRPPMVSFMCLLTKGTAICGLSSGVNVFFYIENQLFNLVDLRITH